ncbi:mu-type opioid receptor-like [Watersipora subatra]|uniref:mu-type opioid receptor-like n=1 Tax=Watersipora subatra TaxID=2589382 RepID=UPI00355B432B
MWENFTAENSSSATVVNGGNRLNWVLYTGSSTVGLILNMLALIIIIRGRRFNRHLRIHLLNLSIADLLSSFLLPFSARIGVVLNISYPDNLILCKIHVSVTYTIFYSSLLFNTAVALEKMMFIYFPFEMLKYTKKHAIVVTVCVWIIAALCQIGLLINSEISINVNHKENLACYPYGVVTEYKPKVYRLFVISSAVKHWAPSAAIAIAYGLIAIKLCCRKNIGESGCFHNRFSCRVLIMLAADGLAVAVWTPYYTWLIVDSFKLPPLQPIAANKNRNIMYLFFSAAMALDCITTPIIYVICNRDFKDDGVEIAGSIFQRLISIKLPARRRSQEVVTSSCEVTDTTFSET